MNNKDLFKKFVHREIVENFKTAYDFCQVFKYDYQNTCKWFKDYKSLPIKTAFELADYLGMRCVVFREIK